MTFRNFLTKTILAAGATALVVAMPTAASAAVYYPSGSYVNTSNPTTSNANDLQDLDHAYYYSWVISGLSTIPSNTAIESASIQFKSLYNWDGLANILHIDLLDSASTSAGTAVTSGTNADGSQSTVRRGSDPAANQNSPTGAELRSDAFDSSNPLASSTAYNGTTGNRLDLEDRSFVGQWASPTSTTALNTLSSSLQGKGFSTSEIGTNTTGADSQLFSLAGWTVGSQGANGGYTYTYNFSSSELTALKSFINNGGTVAIGFDPDCHFYNDGISFQFDTALGGAASAVPEPTSLILLGTGLLATARYRRRRQ